MGDSSISVLSALELARASMSRGGLDQEVARSAGRDRVKFATQDRWAGVVVAVDGASQEAWSRREELSESLYQKLAATRPPDPAETLSASFRELDTSQPVRAETCTNCRIRPGFGPCPRCSGVGVLLVRHPNGDTSTVEDCPECEDGFSTCTVCGGSTKAVVATVRYVDRKPLRSYHLALAPEFAYLKEVIGWGYPDPFEMPEELAVDLERDATTSAYRGAQPGMLSEFRGFRLGDAAQRAWAFVRRVKAAPNFVVRSMRTFVLPFVVASFESSGEPVRIVLFATHDGSVRFQKL